MDTDSGYNASRDDSTSHTDHDSARENGRMSRRHFLKSSAAGVLVGAMVGPGCFFRGGEEASSFESRWPEDVERYWVGQHYWANPLSEWRISEGRLECIGAGDMFHNVHHLTRQLGAEAGTLDLRVQTGFVEDTDGRAGFEVGIEGPLGDYRNNVIRGQGLQAGISADGELFIGDQSEPLDRDLGSEEVNLHLTAAPGDSGLTLALSVLDATSGEEIGQLQRSDLTTEALTGNLALFADVDEDTDRPWGEPRVWFRDWEGGGSRLVADDDQTFGPILFTHYTLSRGTMKMTAQLPPVGEADGSTVQLEIEENGSWSTIDEAPVHDLARTATFRVEDWEDTRDVPFRLVYRYRSGDGMDTHHYEGTVQKDPVDQDEIVVGGLSCAKDTAFPNTEIVEGLRHHDPDLLAFTGDQFYEESGGYVRRAHENVSLATLDVLHRWYEHGWSFGELTRSRPAVCLLDDHDVFHANIWGEGGELIDEYGQMADGGFYMPPEWINAVQRMQTAHLPDPYDPTPVANDISVYYTDLVYGRVSFALLEDRKWKSGPNDFIETDPETPDDWVVDPNFDPEAADAPGATLLGERQLDFLEEWSSDWRGADMKAVISQTSFAQLPTHHGPQFRNLVADLDSNAWPQTPRNEALRRMRKGFAVHVGGDQHLPMMLRYGVDEWNDAPYNFCVPGVAVGWTRAFWPEEPGRNHEPGMPEYTGEYEDGFANKMTVYAVANPVRDFRTDRSLGELSDKSSGYGLIRFQKSDQSITLECWPVLSDPTGGADEQFEGWPKTVAMEDNYAREPVAHLPTVVVEGTTNPMIQVVDEGDGEVVYTRRLTEQTFQPKVFREGPHTVRVGDDATWRETLTGVPPVDEADDSELTVSL